MTADAPAVDPGLLAAAHGQPSGAAPVAPGPAASAVNWRQEAKDIWTCIASLAFVFPSLKAVYPTETIERLADVWAPILERHNFDLGRFMIYFNAGIATLPVAAASFSAIRSDVRAMKAGKQPAPAADSAPLEFSTGAAPAAQASVASAGDGSDVVRPNVPLAPAGPAAELAEPIST